ncbi:MAG: DUF5674 family protein [Planctomycetota bacterium]
MEILRKPIDRAQLAEFARAGFGDMINAVVDCTREIMVVGGELHADGEHLTLEDGSSQRDLWGLNLYPGETSEEWIEFDSMINLRPAQGNRTRGVDDPALRARIREVVQSLITP